jgi:thiamine-monophosphate kinase
VSVATPLGDGREFDRIRAIAAELGARAPGLGDDCAVVGWPGGALVLSTDVSVEEVHFRREWLSLEEIGWRAAAAALSDLAAEGASTVGLLAAVTVPRGASDGDVTSLMRGVGAAAAFAGGPVLGGDLSGGERWSVAVTVVGRAERPVTRGGARAGDGLWVTGALGGARAALEAFRLRREPPPAARARFARPEPRIAAGRWLAAAGARAMLDLSDGLGRDLGHLAAASGVALEVTLDDLPLHPDASVEWGSEGGEDYELLASLPAGFDAAAARRCLAETGVPLARIGRVAEGSGVRCTLGGEPRRPAGWDHFA